jgi:ATP-dependent Lon protease
VILPRSNEKDLRDVPDEVRANMVFTFVGTVDDVFRIALLPLAGAAAPAAVLADHPPVEEAAAPSEGTSVDGPSPNGGVRPPAAPIAPVATNLPADTLR